MAIKVVMVVTKVAIEADTVAIKVDTKVATRMDMVGTRMDIKEDLYGNYNAYINHSISNDHHHFIYQL